MWRAPKSADRNSPSACEPGGKLITDIVETTLKKSGRNAALNPAWTGAILLALEDGFRLHRLIDPETTPADSFLRAIGDLQRAVGVASA